MFRTVAHRLTRFPLLITAPQSVRCTVYGSNNPLARTAVGYANARGYTEVSRKVYTLVVWLCNLDMTLCVQVHALYQSLVIHLLHGTPIGTLTTCRKSVLVRRLSD